MSRAVQTIRRVAGRLVIAIAAMALAGTVAAQPADSPDSWTIAGVNARFLDHLDLLGPESTLAATAIRRGFDDHYRDQEPFAFVADALAQLHPAFAEAFARLDSNELEAAQSAFERLATDGDPFVAASATYLHARVLVRRGLAEEARVILTTASTDERLLAHTAFAPQIFFLKAHCESATLDTEAALATIQQATARFPQAPESVQMGARQLAMELERAEQGTLDEVSGLMAYAAGRLGVDDPGERTQARQQEALDLLDRLIEEARQQEQSGGSARQRSSRRGSPRGATPQRPAEISDAPAGPGRIGDLHEAPPVTPGEMWGKLPPAERERILQALRDRYPSRYRQLVEQYYRSLAEQK